MEQTLRDLAAQMSGEVDPTLRLRKGQVQSVQTGTPTTYTVTLGGATTAIPGVRAFTGTLLAGQVVWLLQQGPLLLAVGAPGAARQERGAIYRNTGQAFLANTQAAVRFNLDGAPFGDGIFTDAWAETYVDRATYPERLRLPATARPGLYVATTNLPLNVVATGIYDVLLYAFHTAGASKGQPQAVERFYAPAAITHLVHLVTRPTFMGPGDWFQVDVLATVNTDMAAGYHINPYVMAHRVGDA